MYNTNDENLVRLKKKIKENPQSFIFILGAGMSVPAGMKAWPELLSGMIDFYEKYCEDKEEDCVQTVKHLRGMKDYWQAFQELKRLLPELEYEKYIMRELSADGRKIPRTYELIWQLDINGVITFNIDKLILDAFSKTKQSAVDYATKKEKVKYNHFISGNHNFVFFPHGYITDPSTWVFTEREKRDTYRDNDFKNIMTTLLNAKNLVIMGFNPGEHNFTTLLNEIAIGDKIAGYDNYYIGPNLTTQECTHFGDYGISCISYKPENKLHPEIEAMLSDMLGYVPKDIEFPSVYSGKTYTEDDIPPYEKCTQMDINELREILNGNISNIIPPNQVPTPGQILKLQEFYRNYVAQMYIAWLVNENADIGKNVYGYNIKSRIGRGAFGNVYEAYDEDGKKYALKILLPEVKDKVEYLSCFRRGIRSMNILKKQNVEGMVKIYSSYEVPACIVMDFVEGITLRKAIEDHCLQTIHKKIEVILQIATIINKAHNLEECILHRDLKPENIMLRDFYFETTEEPIQVVILDFDLSWHKGATELTVALGKMSQGFMAPEQIEENELYKRNTAVDVYSIGMLAYFILVGENPAPYQHQFRNYEEEMMKALEKKCKVAWKCLPAFLMEIIYRATLHEPEKRASLDSFIYNMKVALNIVLSDEIEYSNPLLLREVAYQIENSGKCEIEDFGRKLIMKQDATGKSITMELTQNGKCAVIKAQLSKMRMGQDERAPKYLATAKNRALATVDKSIFYDKIGEIETSAINICVTAKLPEKLNSTYISKLAKNLQEIRIAMELQ